MKWIDVVTIHVCALARVWHVALLLLLAAAAADAAIRDQTWQIVIGGQAAQMKLEGTSFFIASAEEVAESNWTQAGSIGGFEPGAGGLYVGDLDGSGETSIAFHDVRTKAWYHGTIDNRYITFKKIDGSVFQVGDGPTLFPIEESPRPARGGNLPVLGPGVRDGAPGFRQVDQVDPGDRAAAQEHLRQVASGAIARAIRTVR